MTPSMIRPQRRGVGTWSATAVAVAVSVLMIAACGAGSDDGDASTGAEREAFEMSASYDMGSDDMADDFMAEEMPAEEMTETQAATATLAQSDSAGARREAVGDNADGDDGGTASAGTPAVPADLDREIIYTAWLSVESVDVAAAAAEATAIVQRSGGLTFAQQTYNRGQAYTTLTFKIPHAQFAAVLAELGGIGELVEQNVSAEDVTDVVVDLGSRIASAEISVGRLREFLSRATDTEGVAELERELAQRESNLESLRGRLRVLRDQVDLSTITLTITQAADAVPVTSLSLWAWLSAGDGEDPCLGREDLVAPPESDVHFCFELENRGETTLTDVTLRSEALRFAMNELVVPDGMDIERIEPGKRVVATLVEPVSEGRVAGRVATRGLEIDTQVRAVPVTNDGTELAELARNVTLYLHVEEDDSPPGFGDALSGGAAALVTVGNALLLVLGALLPFLPVIAIVAAIIWRWFRRRVPQRAGSPDGGEQS